MTKKILEGLEDADDFSKVNIKEEPNDFLAPTSKRKASKDGTAVPPAPQIVDDTGTAWSLSSEEALGGYVILRDRKRMPGAGVTLLWHTGRVCLRNSPGVWFIWDDANQRWGQTSEPLSVT